MFRLITSATREEHYIGYLPVVVASYRKFFPDCKITLAYVDDTPLETDLCDVINFRSVAGIPNGNAAKLARLYIAGMYSKDLCMINDIDLAVLQRDYYSELLHVRQPDHLLCVGVDTYKDTADAGKFPMSYLTGEGHIFKELCNEWDLDFEDFVHSFVGSKVFDSKEDPSSLIPIGRSECFSDESVVRMLISKGATKVQYVNRGWTNSDSKTLCRSKSWNKEDLLSGKFVECHLPRPYCQATANLLKDYLL